MSSERLRIACLADYPELTETVAAWHWDAWGRTHPGGSPAAWAARLRERSGKGRIPTAFVALVGPALLGAATLVEHGMTTHREWSPWLSGVYVPAEYRGQGVASALVRYAMREAAALGAARLYLYTESARELYIRLGWVTVAEEQYAGQVVTIMAIDLTSPPG